MSKVRRPAVDGQFYPADPARLQEVIDKLMRQAEPGGSVPRAIIAPHAGYTYSGPIAASAYAYVAAGRHTLERIALLSPAHRVPVRGLATSSARAFATPLGDVAVDQQSVEELLAFPQVTTHDEAHAPEHGLEVHLPFLQTVLEEFQIVPFVVGDVPARDVASVLASFAADEKTLIVVSSDLSHFQHYERAVRLDRETSERIEMLQPLAAGQACGRCAINGLLHLARDREWQARTVDLRNSGDTAGSRDQVVGYGAYLFD